MNEENNDLIWVTRRHLSYNGVKGKCTRDSSHLSSARNVADYPTKGA